MTVTAFVGEKWAMVRNRLRAVTGAQWLLIVLVLLLLAYFAVLAGAPRAGGGGR